MVIDSVDRFIFENLPEAKGKVKRLSGGGGGDNAIEVRISGDDQDVLYALAEDIKAELRQIDGAKNARDSWGPRTKKLIVDIDQTRAQFAGVTSQDIALSLQTVLNGLETGQFREGDKVIPIVMRNNQAHESNIQDLESMNVYAQQSGQNVPLRQVADLDVEWQAAKILRRDLTRTISVTSGLESGYTAAEVTSQLQPWLEEQRKSWPSGYELCPGRRGRREREGDRSSHRLPAVVVLHHCPVAYRPVQLNPQTTDYIADHSPGIDRRSVRIVGRPFLLWVYAVPRRDLSGRHCDQQRHCADRPYPS